MNVLSNYSMHHATWSECKQCPIGRYSNSRIFYKGSIPADILIVGEAPGDTDLVLNKPFAGPAGRLLDKILAEAFEEVEHEVHFCMTYSILCSPCEPPQFKMRTPSENEIRNCSSRLQNFYDIVAPSHVIAAGRIAEKAVKRLRAAKSANPPDCTVIQNPISILNQAEQGTLDYKRAVSALKEINI